MWVALEIFIEMLPISRERADIDPARPHTEMPHFRVVLPANGDVALE